MIKKNNIQKRKLEGVVVSDKMTQTAVVAVTRVKTYPKYRKQFKTTSRFKAQNDNNEYKTGDRVVIEETRPLSRGKRWKIVSRGAQNNSKTQ